MSQCLNTIIKTPSPTDFTPHLRQKSSTSRRNSLLRKFEVQQHWIRTSRTSLLGRIQYISSLMGISWFFFEHPPDRSSIPYRPRQQTRSFHSNCTIATSLAATRQNSTAFSRFLWTVSIGYWETRSEIYLRYRLVFSFFSKCQHCQGTFITIGSVQPGAYSPLELPSLTKYRSPASSSIICD